MRLPDSIVRHTRYAACWEHTNEFAIEPNVIGWLERNCTTRYVVKERATEREGVYIDFLDPKDAVLFALAWW